MSSEKFFETPLIALFDTDENVKELLTKHRFSCEEATLGSIITNIPNTKEECQHLVKLNNNYPKNLHEFDIFVFDLTKEKSVGYAENNLSIESQPPIAFRCKYPQKTFDPRPFTVDDIKAKTLQIINSKSSIIIAFCGKEKGSKYNHEYCKIEKIILENPENFEGFKKLEKDASIFDFYMDFPKHRESKTGTKFQLLEEPMNKKQRTLSSLLGKYLSDSKYYTTFTHPKPYNNVYRRCIEDRNFFPLLFNIDNDIVSFYHKINNPLFNADNKDIFPKIKDNKRHVFVFPDIADKAKFLSKLFNECLPEIIPDLFPNHRQFLWLKSEDYLPPKEKELRQRKQEYEEKIKNVENEIEANKKEYQFLHDLLWQTADDLVKTIGLFLKWLGFTSVKNMDEEKRSKKEEEKNEEDLQIETENRLLVIEVKGIGGTSTDDNCSQINKIKNKRAEEARGKFDVFGLYIVNHQRYTAPKERENPPFSDDQKKDAEYSKRGLLTTYDLYKSYFLIEDGLLTKEDVKEKLFDFGLITLEPKNLIFLGKPTEVLKKGTVVILTLTGEITLEKGDELIAKENIAGEKKDYRYHLVKVCSIWLDDKDVEKANIGEVGIKFDYPIKKGTEIYKKRC